MFLDSRIQTDGVIGELSYGALPDGQEGESGEGDTDEDTGP